LLRCIVLVSVLPAVAAESCCVLYQGAVASARELHTEKEEQLVSAPGVHGLVLQALGSYAAAIQIHKEEVALQKTAQGETGEMKVAESMRRLAFALDKDGKYEEAETYHRRHWQHLKSVRGEDHPDTLASLTDLAVALQHQSTSAPLEEAHELLHNAFVLSAMPSASQLPLTHVYIYICLSGHTPPTCRLSFESVCFPHGRQTI